LIISRRVSKNIRDGLSIRGGIIGSATKFAGSASKQLTQLGFLLRQADMFPPNLREFLRAGGSSQIILILLGVVLLAKAIMSIRR
jgi:hypothetical protein